MKKNPMIGPIIADNIDDVKKIVAFLRIQIQDAISCRMLLQPIAADDFHLRFKGSKNSKSLRFTLSSVLNEFAMCLARIHDNPKKGRFCLAQAFAEIKKAKFKVTPASAGNQQFFFEAEQTWNVLRTDKRLRVLHNVRNFRIAHSIVGMWDHQSIPIQELFFLCKETESIIEKLAKYTLGTEVSLRSHEIIWRDDVDEFWSHMYKI